MLFVPMVKITLFMQFNKSSALKNAIIAYENETAGD
jgi:hypothetical protein